MPPDQPATPEDARMITFIAIAPDGTADQYRRAGHSISWRAWAETLQCRVSIPED